MQGAIAEQARASRPAATDRPLAVALEGVLLRTGVAAEARLAELQKRPWRAFVPGDFAAAVAAIDVAALPYDHGALAQVAQARATGRRVLLVARGEGALADRVAAHLGVFDAVVAPDDPVLFGDMAAEAAAPGPHRGGTLRAWTRALRLHQWVKNALVFVPALAGWKLADPSWVAAGAWAFLCFGLCASSVYVLNDLLDLADDRHHKLKRHRPFAAGDIPLEQGIVAFPLLLAAAFALASALLPPMFTVALAAYYVLTLAYSLKLKQVMALDVIALAMLYTLRVLAGAAAIGTAITFWLLAFALFLFLSLALAKRHAELRDALERGRTGKTRGRDYHPQDLQMIAALGAASGYQAVMVLALYVHDNSSSGQHERPEVMWLACPILLFWITRVWMITHRGGMHEDPVVFAARDWTSQACGVLFALAFLAAS